MFRTQFFHVNQSRVAHLTLVRDMPFSVSLPDLFPVASVRGGPWFTSASADKRRGRVENHMTNGSWQNNGTFFESQTTLRHCTLFTREALQPLGCTNAGCVWCTSNKNALKRLFLWSTHHFLLLRRPQEVEWAAEQQWGALELRQNGSFFSFLTQTQCYHSITKKDIGRQTRHLTKS